jgi:hypothetical protein
MGAAAGRQKNCSAAAKRIALAKGQHQRLAAKTILGQLGHRGFPPEGSSIGWPLKQCPGDVWVQLSGLRRPLAYETLGGREKNRNRPHSCLPTQEDFLGQLKCLSVGNWTENLVARDTLMSDKESGPGSESGTADADKT